MPRAGSLEQFAAEPADRAAQLACAIRRVRPDLVHWLEMQRAAYLTLEARQRFGAGFPPWIYSCWGNDVFSLPARLRPCAAHSRGAGGVSLPDRRLPPRRRTGPRVGLPRHGPGRVSGSRRLFELNVMLRHRAAGPVAARRVVAVKGYYEARSGAGAGWWRCRRCTAVPRCCAGTRWWSTRRRRLCAAWRCTCAPCRGPRRSCA